MEDLGIFETTASLSSSMLSTISLSFPLFWRSRVSRHKQAGTLNTSSGWGTFSTFPVTAGPSVAKVLALQSKNLPPVSSNIYSHPCESSPTALSKPRRLLWTISSRQFRLLLKFFSKLTAWFQSHAHILSFCYIIPYLGASCLTEDSSLIFLSSERILLTSSDRAFQRVLWYLCSKAIFCGTFG